MLKAPQGCSPVVPITLFRNIDYSRLLPSPSSRCALYLSLSLSPAPLPLLPAVCTCMHSALTPFFSSPSCPVRLAAAQLVRDQQRDGAHEKSGDHAQKVEAALRRRPRRGGGLGPGGRWGDHVYVWGRRRRSRLLLLLAQRRLLGRRGATARRCPWCLR
jgi:hypothetical protein